MNSSEKKAKGTSAQKTQAVYERLWLTYCNETLYAKGLITEEQRNRMRSRIVNRTGR